MSGLKSDYYQAVLFDVDGTLIDTAPDMVAVLQELQNDHGEPPVDYETGRSQVSNGAVGLLRLGFPDAGEARIEELRQLFLASYALRVCELSGLFEGLDALLKDLEAASIRWGVVTNKPHFLTMPLMAGLGLAERAACIVSGDTLPQRKPDPAPVLHACEIAGVEPHHALYVGDAARDIDAGRAANAGTIAAAYGYIADPDDPRRWQADALAADTTELAQIVTKAVNLES